MDEDHGVARRRFDLFGFEVLPGLLSPFIDGIFDDLSRAFNDGSGLRGTSERRSIPDFLGRSPALRHTAETVGLPTVASALSGKPVIYLYGDASEYRGDTYWHADTEFENARLIKFVLYDSVLDAATGALRVLPGSHRAPHAYRTEGLPAREIPAYAIHVQPGDVIAFDPRLRHAALGGDVRRQVAVIYAVKPNTAAARAELMNLIMADQTVV